MVAGCCLKGQRAFSGVALRETDQAFAVEVEVDEGEVRAQPVVVLGDTSIAHLVETEDSLEDAEDMFYLRSYF